MNGKIYVGETDNLTRRWGSHKRSAVRGTNYPLYRAFTKWGANNFDFRIIQTFDAETDALEAEMYWIAYYRTNIKRYPDGLGYNMTDGGEGASGVDNGRAKISSETATIIKQMVVQGQTSQQIAKELAIAKHIVDDIGCGRTWKSIVVDGFDDRERSINMHTSGAVLTEHDVRTIKQMIMQQATDVEISKQFNIGRSTVQHIRHGDTWKDIQVSSFVVNIVSNGKVGQNNSSARLTNDQVINIIRLLNEGILSMKSIGDMYGITKQTIYSIKHNKTWKHIPR